MTDHLPPDMAVSVISAVGGGLPVWQYLDSRQQVRARQRQAQGSAAGAAADDDDDDEMGGAPGSPLDSGGPDNEVLMSSKAAFRLTCKLLKHHADRMMDNVNGVAVGCYSADDLASRWG